MELIENTLEGLSILNTLYYYSNPSIKNVVIEDNKDINVTQGKFLVGWGEQATIASILWLKKIMEDKKIYLYTDNTSYYEVKEFQDIVKLKYPEFKNRKKLNRKNFIIYYLDPVPGVLFDTDNEEFKKKNILFKITNILGNKQLP